MIYVLLVERWGGAAYYTEVVAAYADEDLALNHVKQYQGNQLPADVRYFLEDVRLIGAV